MSTKKTPPPPPFNPTKWVNEHRDFVDWWKEHRDSGYAENRGGKSRWGILPWKAYYIEAYRAEYTGFPTENISAEDIAAMRAEQRKTEALTAALEKRFGLEFWKRMTREELIAACKQVAREMIPETPPMEAKIDKAYEHEPGQSEAETELLARRRVIDRASALFHP